MGSITLGGSGAYVGGLIGSAILPGLGTAIGTAIGAGIGGSIGGYIDQTLIFPAIFGAANSNMQGPRVDDFRLQTASEGAAINFVLGPENRVAGNIIWIGPLEEEETETETESGGKGGGASGEPIKGWAYYTSLAIAFCEGPIEAIEEIYADDKLIYRGEGVGTSEGGGSAEGANLIAFSQAFEDESWKKDDIQASDDASADPVGGNNASLLTLEPIGGDRRRLEQSKIAVKPSTAYTLSFYVKQSGLPTTRTSASYLIYSDSDDNVIVTNSYSITTTWQRITVTFTTSSTTSYVDVKPIEETTGAAGTMLLFGVQLNIGSAATTYVPTTETGSDARFDFIRFYLGTETQTPDSLIQEIEGAGNVAGYRGTAFIVIKRLALADFGNRVPNMTAKIRQRSVMPIADAISLICSRANSTQLNVQTEGIAGNISGLLVSGPQSVAKQLEPLMMTYDISVRDRGGTLVFFDRKSTEPVNVSEQLVSGLMKFKESDPRSLPSIVGIKYYDPLANYQRGSQTYRRYNVDSEVSSILDIPITMQGEEAQRLCRRMMYTAWNESTMLEPTIFAPSMIAVEEGDLIRIARKSGDIDNIRVTKRTRGANYHLEIAGVLEYSTSLFQEGQADTPNGPTETGPYRPAILTLEILDVPAARAEDIVRPVYYYGTACTRVEDEWRGSTLYAGPSDTALAIESTTTVESTMGKTESFLSPIGNTASWNDSQTLNVYIPRGELVSKTADQVVSGENWMIVGDEIIAFKTATLTGVGRYTLSGLARGVRGSEWAMNTHRVGERAILFKETLLVANRIANTLVNTARNYRSVAAGATLAGTETQISGLIFKSNTLRPFGPVNLAGPKDGTNNRVITFTRRSRKLMPLFQFDSSLLEGDLDEFRLQIYSGTTLIRTAMITASHSFSYTASLQVADGIVAGSPITIVIQQNSAYAGIGYGYASRLYLP